ncbi:MAG TPA: response regulator [Lacunisphaera sp.]|jgi:CheY-like chemotaxis protein|nr:response regulator [Lacunisphaera sp.]
MKPRGILLVDDNPRDAEMTLDALQQYNLANEVTVLHDGAEALDYMFRRGEFVDRGLAEPAVILLDLKMPKVDGLEVLRQLKADPRLHVIPIVVMTSSREDQDLKACYKLGVNAYVVKPVSFHEFIEAVRALGAFWVVLNEAPPPGSHPPMAAP